MGFWGLTRVTAHDEMLLLKVLKGTHSILDKANRGPMRLSLMANVIPLTALGASRPGTRLDMTAAHDEAKGWLLPDPVLLGDQQHRHLYRPGPALPDRRADRRR